MSERTEALMRIVVGIVSGLILGVWKMLVQVLGIINFIWTLISGKRILELAELCEMWNTQTYVFLRYMTFVTNERPMPFRSLTKNYSKVSKK